MTAELRQLKESNPENAAPAGAHADHELAPSGTAATAENPFAGLWSSLLKWSALLITLGGLALHVAGFIYHSDHAKAWGLDADLFPKSIEWILITGYYVVLAGVVKLFLFFRDEWWKLAIWGIAVGTCVWVCMLLIIHGREDLPRQLVRRYTKHLPKWLLALGLSYGFAGVFCVAVAFAPAFVVTLFYGPALLASNFAQQDAERDLKQYALGCDHASQKRHCLILKRDNQPDLRGFLIDSSDTLLAIYLPAQKLVQVLPREGVELMVSAGVESKAADKTDGKNRNEKDLGRI